MERLLENGRMRLTFCLSLLLVSLSVQAKTPEPAPAAPTMNEIAGRVQSVDLGESVLRVSTESGYRVTFSFNRETKLTGLGLPKSVEDLKYEELVTVRYQGKELLALEIEKRSLASVP